MDTDEWLGFAVALGLGLLIGAERERRKGEDGGAAAAGVRTFALTALLGAACATIQPWLLAPALVAVALLSAAAYLRHHGEDAGLTTETALLATLALGALATEEPVLAAALAVAAAVLLAARVPLHRFVRGAISDDELRDLLALAAATLVVLPLMPDRQLGPFDAVNPRTLWIVAILVMAIGASGHVALRLLGARLGLPLTGLLAGFASSTATIGAMGARARRTPQLRRPAVAGAVLSTVATVVQLAVVLAAVHRPTLRALAAPLAWGGLAALGYGVLFTWRSVRDPSEPPAERGPAFSARAAIALVALIAVASVLAAALDAWYGRAGLLVAAGVAGLADAHAAAVTVASGAAGGRIAAGEAVVPILIALSTNTVSKLVAAFVAGGTGFALRVVPGLLLVAAALWGGYLWG